MYHFVISLDSARFAQEVIRDRRDLRAAVEWTASNAFDIGEEMLEEMEEELRVQCISFYAQEMEEELRVQCISFYAQEIVLDPTGCRPGLAYS